jgi:hypothetical protein
MSDAEKKAQERELEKIAGASAADEFEPNIQGPVVPETPPSAASLQMAGYMMMAVNMVCGVMAAKRGGHWQLSETENAQLHIAVARVAEKYVLIDLNTPLMQLGAVAGAIFLPRLAMEFMAQPAQAERVPDGD